MPTTSPITLLSGQTTNGGSGVDWGGGPGCYGLRHLGHRLRAASPTVPTPA